MSEHVMIWLLFEQDGAYLLTRRKPESRPFAGMWTLPGDVMSPLSFPESPRSVSECRNSLLTRSDSFELTTWPMFAASDCFWKYVLRWMALSRLARPLRKNVVPAVPPRSETSVSYDRGFPP